MKFLSAVLLLAISHAHGAVIRYEGDSTPDSGANAANWSTVVFAGTGWSSDGGTLTLATASQRGIWFGWADYVGDTPSWSLSPNSVGNRASMRAKLLPNSGEWEMYIGDPDGYFTALDITDANTVLWSYNDALGSHETTINLVTTEFHTYELLLKQGMATFIIDDLVRGQAFVAPGSSANILLFGDGSGGTPTGYGGLAIDFAQIDLSPIPEPSVALLVCLGALGFRRRRPSAGL